MERQTRFALESVPLPDSPGTETLELLASHSSVRAYLPDIVPDSMLNAILLAAQSGSTSNNLQSYSIIKVTDLQKRAALSEIAGGQHYMQECPAFLVFCPDLYRLRVVCERQGYHFANHKMELFLQAVVDATIAGQNAAIAAEAMGLGIVYIGAIRNDIKAAARILGLPPGVFALFGMCIGYPAGHSPVMPRLPQSIVVHENTYTTSALDEILSSYVEIKMADAGEKARQVAAGLQNTGTNVVYGWFERTAHRLSTAIPKRGQLMQLLEEQGFEF